MMSLLEIAKAHNWNIPTKCGRCYSELFLNDSGFPECPNPSCPAKIEHQLSRFLSILGVKLAGSAFIKTVVKDTAITFDPLQYFINIAKCDDKVQFNKWAGGKNGEKVLSQIKPYLWKFAKDSEPKSITTAQFLAMFDYPSLSTKQFEKIESLSLGNFFSYTEDQLKNMNGIGDKVAGDIINFREEYKEKIQVMSHLFNIKDEAEEKTDASLPTICFTGACPGHSRKELETMCAGKYIVVGGVTKDTKFLACADPNSGSNKLKTATKNGTKIISYDDLLKEIA